MKPASVNKMSTVPTETLDELAARVVDLTGRITSYLTAQGLPQPSFARDGGLEEYPEAPQVKGPRMRLIETLWDMLHLAMGGKDYVFMNSIVPHNDAMILSVLDRFDFWSAVPLSGSASYADVAARTQLPETLVRRILRHAMTMRLFAQAGQSSDGPSSGVDAAQDGKSSTTTTTATSPDTSCPPAPRIVHTATTAFVARHPAYRSWIAMNQEDTHPACTALPDALHRWARGRGAPPQELTETGFSVACAHRVGERGTFWDLLREDEREGEAKGFRMRRFAQAMAVGRENSAVDTMELVQKGFDWGGLGEGTVVDVGGSSGHDAVALVRAFPRLKVVVQDQASVEPAFRAFVPADLAARGRVTFQTHDFFEPQPIVGADVYFVKLVLHDWPDKYAARILSSLVPALCGGSRIVLCESVVPSDGPSEVGGEGAVGGGVVGGGAKEEEGGKPAGGARWRDLPLPAQKMLSTMDMQMLALFNAGQRTVEDWRALLREADARLELVKVVESPGFARGVLEVAFREA